MVNRLTNGKVPTNGKGSTNGERHQLIEMARAVHDAVHDAIVEKLPGLVAEAMQGDEVKMRIAMVVADATRAAVADLTQHIAKMDAELKSWFQKVEEEYSAGLDETQARFLEAFQKTVASLPAAQVRVTIPENAIKVEMEPGPPVQVTIPENAIKVETSVKTPPRPRMVEKSIVYGPDGRPQKIIETTADGE